MFVALSKMAELLMASAKPNVAFNVSISTVTTLAVRQQPELCHLNFFYLNFIELWTIVCSLS